MGLRHFSKNQFRMTFRTKPTIFLCCKCCIQLKAFKLYFIQELDNEVNSSLYDQKVDIEHHFEHLEKWWIMI